MKNVFFNVNPYKDADKIYHKIKPLLCNAGYNETKNGNEAELAISIGGDGTFLDTVRIAPKADIIGINRGTLGYLAEVSPKDAVYAIENYLNNNYIIEKRMMAECQFVSSLSYKEQNLTALNDVVVTKRNSSVIDLSISIDGNVLARYYADGLIISTPTGSTGYAFSCGAPIINPTSDMLIITPIAPHTVMNRSICVSSNSEIKVTVVSARNDNYYKVSVDGYNYETPIDIPIEIRKSDSYVKLVKFDNDTNFLERVMSKMCSI